MNETNDPNEIRESSDKNKYKFWKIKIKCITLHYEQEMEEDTMSKSVPFP